MAWGPCVPGYPQAQPHIRQKEADRPPGAVAPTKAPLPCNAHPPPRGAGTACSCPTPSTRGRKEEQQSGPPAEAAPRPGRGGHTPQLGYEAGAWFWTQAPQRAHQRGHLRVSGYGSIGVARGLFRCGIETAPTGALRREQAMGPAISLRFRCGLLFLFKGRTQKGRRDCHLQRNAFERLGLHATPNSRDNA